MIKASELMSMIEKNDKYEGTYWIVDTAESVIVERDSGKKEFLEKGERLIVREGRLLFPDIHLNHVYLHAEAMFEEVRKKWIKVPFMEAAQAFADGKRIKVVDRKDKEIEKEYEGEKILALMDVYVLSAALTCDWFIYKYEDEY